MSTKTITENKRLCNVGREMEKLENFSKWRTMDETKSLWN